MPSRGCLVLVVGIQLPRLRRRSAQITWRWCHLQRSPKCLCDLSCELAVRSTTTRDLERTSHTDIRELASLDRSDHPSQKHDDVRGVAVCPCELAESICVFSQEVDAYEREPGF